MTPYLFEPLTSVRRFSRISILPNKIMFDRRNYNLVWIHSSSGVLLRSTYRLSLTKGETLFRVHYNRWVWDPLNLRTRLSLTHAAFHTSTFHYYTLTLLVHCTYCCGLRLRFQTKTPSSYKFVCESFGGWNKLPYWFIHYNLIDRERQINPQPCCQAYAFIFCRFCQAGEFTRNKVLEKSLRKRALVLSWQVLSDSGSWSAFYFLSSKCLS